MRAPRGWTLAALLMMPLLTGAAALPGIPDLALPGLPGGLPLGPEGLPATGGVVSEAIDLRVNGLDRIQGLLERGPFYPGERVVAILELTIRLPSADMDAARLLETRFWSATEAFDPRGDSPVPLDEMIIVDEAFWGTDDLLSTSDGGVDLRAATDGDAQHGNGDGRVSLRELRAGISGLPSPGPTWAPTGLRLGILFAPEAGNEFQDDALLFDLGFEVGDRPCPRATTLACGNL